jgi:Transposase, Mutator family
MTKNTTKAAAVAAGAMLFDNWFNPIEDAVREKVRGVIETIMEEELDATLSRPRYGRRKAAGSIDDAAPIAGSRHGHRTRTLTGTFGKTQIGVPRARIKGEDGKTSEWKSRSLRGYQRRTKQSRSSDRGHLSFRNQHPPRAPRAFGGFQRRCGQGCGQPYLAER